MASARSRTSLQLALENDRLTGEQAEYVAALEPRGQDGDDIVGFAFAVNGKLNSADVYPSNGLFRKMWPKLLRASVTEAIGERDAAGDRPPPPADVSRFIDAANRGAAVAASAGDQANIRMRDSAGAMVLEARPAAAPAAGWVHRSYLAK